MRAPWCPFARRRSYLRWPTGPFADNVNRKAVWHTTEGSDTVLDWYEMSGGIPHFTILTTGDLVQHYGCDQFSRALRNLPGGVETNRDGAIQIEIVGYAGSEHTAAQRRTITLLAAWLTGEQHVRPVVPMGRMSRPYRVATLAEWDHGVGHFGHGQIPEQNHTDPDMTDATWAALLAGLAGAGEPPDNPTPTPPTSGLPLLFPGTSGPAVAVFKRNVNALLDLHGSNATPLTVNGAYDPQAVTMCRVFQRWANIAVDGIVGPQTWTALGRALDMAAVVDVRRRYGFDTGRRHPDNWPPPGTPWT